MVAAGPALNRFIAAIGFANLADGIATIAWAWTASALTRDPLLISLVAVALRLPWAVFALAAGIVTDRADRRLLILRMDLLRLCAFLAAGLALWFASPLDSPRDELVASSVAYIALLVCALVVGAQKFFAITPRKPCCRLLFPRRRWNGPMADCGAQNSWGMPWLAHRSALPVCAVRCAALYGECRNL